MHCKKSGNSRGENLDMMCVSVVDPTVNIIHSTKFSFMYMYLHINVHKLNNITMYRLLSNIFFKIVNALSPFPCFIYTFPIHLSFGIIF